MFWDKSIEVILYRYTSRKYLHPDICPWQHPPGVEDTRKPQRLGEFQIEVIGMELDCFGEKSAN